MADERRELLDLILDVSFERRKVVLSSGRESDFYVDARQTTLHAEGAALIATGILGLLATVAMVACIVMLAVGFGLWTLRQWARVATIALSVLGLMFVPIGTLIGGVILGVSQAVGAQLNPGWQVLAGHLVFLLVLAIRPRGLFPRIN